MSVVGIGTDIVEINRLNKMNPDALEKLAQRVLTPGELVKFKEKKFKSPFLAKRWAGKEAAAKALGTGIASGISFQHMEIKSLEGGQPVLILSSLAKEKALSLNATSWHISLSDEAEYAVAFVVISQ